jgi:hypothetical protein
MIFFINSSYFPAGSGLPEIDKIRRLEVRTLIRWLQLFFLTVFVCEPPARTTTTIDEKLPAGFLPPSHFTDRYHRIRGNSETILTLGKYDRHPVS